MDIRILEDLGLSNAEAKIYLALLELGPSKTGKIIDLTKLQSSTVYHVLGSLVEKGIVSYIFKGKIKFYQAESPGSLAMFLEEKKRKLNSIMKELKEKEQIGQQKQSAKVYEGMKGLTVAFNEILTTLKKGDEYYFFQLHSEKLKEKRIILFFKNHHLKRADKGIIVKGLSPNQDRSPMGNIFSGLKHTKIRFVEEFLPNGVIIYKNKVITVAWEDILTAFVIESESVANSYKKFFLEKWKKAKK